jgi:glycosyltransferase involved in cell wall biosynthesis
MASDKYIWIISDYEQDHPVIQSLLKIKTRTEIKFHSSFKNLPARVSKNACVVHSVGVEARKLVKSAKLVPQSQIFWLHSDLSHSPFQALSEEIEADLQIPLQPEGICSNRLPEIEYAYSRNGKKVVMLAPIVTHSIGGLQRQVHLQSRELQAKGNHIYLIQNKDPELSEMSKFENWRNVVFMEVDNFLFRLTKNVRIFQRLRGLAFTLTALWKIFEMRRKISIVHAHQLYSPTLVGALAKTLASHLRLVVRVTASGLVGELQELRRLSFRGLRSWAFKKVDSLIVLNKEMQAEMQELGFEEKKIHLIPNGVQLHKEPQTPKRIKKAESLKILYTGRISTEKGLDTLVAATTRLAEEGLKIELNIVGASFADRDPSSELAKLIEKTPKDLDVVFHGFHDELEHFYRETDIFVLASRSEGMSNSLLEAMSYACLCVVSGIPPNKQLIRNEQNGVLFKVGHIQDLADKIQSVADRLHGSKEERDKIWEMRLAARRKIERAFAGPVIADRINELYTELLEARTKRRAAS